MSSIVEVASHDDKSNKVNANTVSVYKKVIHCFIFHLETEDSSTS